MHLCVFFFFAGFSEKYIRKAHNALTIVYYNLIEYIGISLLLYILYVITKKNSIQNAKC